MTPSDRPELEQNYLSREEQFLRDVHKIVDENLKNERFGVEDLADALAMSRIQLYRRLHNLVGKNVSQYIREIRLEKAKTLLENHVASVAEIGYCVGFRSPAYFNKCFHDFYGITPGMITKKRLTDHKTREKIKNKKIQNKKRGILTHPFFPLPYNFLLLVVLIIVISVFSVKIIQITTATVKAKNRTIAVLPFRNGGPELGNKYLCNALHDEILTSLQKIGNLSVRSGQSVEQYRETKKDLATIARELNVGYIVDASISHTEDSVPLLWVKLIDAKKDELLWTEPYTVPNDIEMIEIPSLITKRIANTLGAVLTPDEEKRIIPKYTKSIDSYNYSIKGEQEMDNFLLYWDRKHRESALSLFSQALAIDPENVRALVGKGNTYLYIGEPDSVIFYCDKAILIDPEFSESYYVKGNYYNYIKKYDLAIQNFLKTIDLAPNDARVFCKLGQLYFDKRNEVFKGLFYLNKSLELNVNSLPEVFYWLGMCYMHIGEYERAKNNFLKTIELGLGGLGIERFSWCLTLQRKHQEALIFLDTICILRDHERIYYREYWFHNLMQGDYILAEKYYQKFREKGYELQPIWKAALAEMYFHMGRDKEGQLILERNRNFFENHLKNFGENWYNTLYLSQIYAMMNEKEKSLKYLAKAVDFGMLWGWQDIFDINRIYKNLWEESQFKNLIIYAKMEKSDLRTQVLALESGRGQ